jgi:homoserine O-acetyltransferase
MTVLSLLLRAAASVVLSLVVFAAAAADYPAPREGEWVAPDFRFHTGEVMPELRMHYTTVGEPSGEPVLILHGTTGSGTGMLSPAFAGELFGLGQPLDASKYFIILPDAVGAGKSSKPSDGLRLIPGSEDTRGHGTTGLAKFWKQQVQELLQTAPRRTM